jgi:hypothetical protein
MRAAARARMARRGAAARRTAARTHAWVRARGRGNGAPRAARRGPGPQRHEVTVAADLVLWACVSQRCLGRWAGRARMRRRHTEGEGGARRGARAAPRLPPCELSSTCMRAAHPMGPPANSPCAGPARRASCGPRAAPWRRRPRPRASRGAQRGVCGEAVDKLPWVWVPSLGGWSRLARGARRGRSKQKRHARRGAMKSAAGMRWRAGAKVGGACVGGSGA